MVVNVRPSFKVLANSDDITAAIASRLKSLRLVDETGDTADTLEITLADTDPAKPIAIPPTGGELRVFLGYDGAVTDKGLFVCDEIELSGPPNEMVIRARAAPYTESKGGKTHLQTQKTRSWPKGTTVGALVSKIAKEHGLDPAVTPELSRIALPHTDQSSESDMALLQRLAKRYDAVAKPAGGRLLFVKRGDAKTAGGEAMPTVTITHGMVSAWRVTMASRESAGTVVAYYRDTGKAKRKEVAVGTGEPVYRLRMGYKDQASAVAAAQAEQRRRARNQQTIGVTLPGDPSLSAEAVIVMQAFRPGVDGEWLASRVEHYVGPNGYRCTIEGEKPNSDGNVAKSASAVEETDQAGAEEGGQ